MANNASQNQTCNGIDTLSVKKMIEDIQKDPKLGKCEFRVKNKWVQGDQNRAEVRDFYGAGMEQKHKQSFHFQMGEPSLLAGNDEGANPVEVLLSSLSGCITTTFAYFAALNNYTIKKMESMYRGELDLQGLFNLDPNIRPGYQKIYISFKIETDAPVEALEQYYHFSPVYDVISKSVPIEINIETYQ